MPPNILIVQPDPVQVQRLLPLIQELGQEALCVGSAEEALPLLLYDRSLELLVLELTLPGMDGFELLQRVRERRPAQSLAALALTAFPEQRAYALRRRRELGLEAVESTKASALDLKVLLERLLQGLPQRSPAGKLSAPPEVFRQLQQQRDSKRLAKVTALHLSQDLPLDAALSKLALECAAAFEHPGVLLSVELGGQRYRACHSAGGSEALEALGQQDAWGLEGACFPAEGQPGPVAVADARASAPYSELPLVRAGLAAALSAAPIAGPGLRGFIALIDSRPRPGNPADLELLTALARRAAGEIDLHQRLHELKADRSVQWNRAMQHLEHLELLRGVLESLHLGIVLNGQDGRIILANQRVCELLGMERAAVERRGIEDFTLDLLERSADPDKTTLQLKVLEQGPYVADEILELALPRRRMLRWSARPIQVDEAWCQLATFEDLTAELDLEAQREALATADPLTELLNRRGVEEEGMREAERCRRQKRVYSLLRLQLDGLAEVNAQRGFAEGDFALQVVGACLRQSLRLVDRPGRWSGRQFLVVLPETDEVGARLVAERICQAVKRLDVGLPLSLRGGVACCGDDTAFQACLGLAEKRLEAAQNAPLGTVL